MEYELTGTKIYTRLCLMGALIYPAWSLFLYQFAPHRFDDPIGRMLVGLVFLAVFLFHKRLGEKVILATHVAATICMVHFATMIARGGAENSLLFGGLILSTAMFFAFLNHPREYMIHILIVSCAIIGFTKYYGVFSESIRFTGQIILIYFVKFFVARIFRAHSRLIIRLRSEKTALLQQQKDLIVQNLKDAQSVFTSLSAIHDGLPKDTRIQSFYRPAAEAGGDWISHYYSEKRGWLVAAVGDVTGHDLISSLVTISVAGAARGTFDSLSPTCDSLEQLVMAMAHAADQSVRHSGIRDRHMSAGFVGLDLRTGQGAYVCCGHLPLLLKSDGQTEMIATQATTLLGSPEFVPEMKAFALGSTSSLLLYTDGLIENGAKELSERRLHRLVERSADVFSTLTEFTKEYSDDDDLAFFVIERKVA